LGLLASLLNFSDFALLELGFLQSLQGCVSNQKPTDERTGMSSEDKVVFWG
jgi:hypothetical protein